MNIDILVKIIETTAKFLNNYATLILVIITGIYAYFTYKMAKLMAKQVVADIQVSNIILLSTFAKNWFKERLEKRPEEINKSSSFDFNLLFDIRNRSSGSGSIDKPMLILKFINDGFEYLLLPITKSIRWIPKTSTYPPISEEEITDLGGTIYLRGGESQKIELNYTLLDFDDELLRNIKENLNSLEYYIKFTDNLGKNYLLKINDVRGEQKVT
jgi:hypothetical protein